jgi:sulfur carrier protein
VRVLIRNPRRREVEVHGRRQVASLLRELSLSGESHLVIRGEAVLTGDQWLEDDDRVEILSAVSGGRGCAA